MFAVRRTASVPGRMLFLIASRMTINDIKIVGVPCGSGFSNMWFVFLINLKSINITHGSYAL